MLLLELEKDFIDLEDIKLNDGEIKIKREIEELFFKPIFFPIEEMDWFFKKKELKKLTSIRKIWYNWWINYTTKPLIKSVSVLKDKVMSLYKTNTPKQTVYGRGKKLSKPRKQNIKKPFISETNKERIKDRIIKDIWKLFL